MAKFELGRLVATHTVAEQMSKSRPFYNFVYESLKRFLDGDWGDISDDDKALNNEAVASVNHQIQGVYRNQTLNTTIWIITEWDRSATTVLFPDEY